MIQELYLAKLSYFLKFHPYKLKSPFVPKEEEDEKISGKLNIFGKPGEDKRISSYVI